ncbi:MBL fold metallo-hydrolase [Luminiphilus sp.]|jgi:glyoxylase-like metal-dependent hydrolase (beta-lactamase superfamily II)|nr:MBL fold metallo-hydrolase [Luminiphilus sp.]
MTSPHVAHFFDADTATLTYVVTDTISGHCAVVDPVLNLDYASGSIGTHSADQVIAYIKAKNLSLALILETHIHADHLSSAPYLQDQLGGHIAIGSHITTVQDTFGAIFDEDEGFRRDGSQFDLMLSDGDTFHVGDLQGRALHVPGHTPACMAYQLGDALFAGDTLFMPDAGTARCDFPGGDARLLYESCQRLLSLDDDTRVFVCHDYQPNGRALAFVSTVAQQRHDNVHVGGTISSAEFVSMREQRDATLAMPSLILPALQVNMRAGYLPPPNGQGRLFLKVPINAFGGANLERLPAAT